LILIWDILFKRFANPSLSGRDIVDYLGTNILKHLAMPDQKLQE
jgi:hypothetical protein